MKKYKCFMEKIGQMVIIAFCSKIWITGGPDIAGPISPNFSEIYISNNFLSVMNDVIFMIEFIKSNLINFNLIGVWWIIKFYGFWWFTSFKHMVKLRIKFIKSPINFQKSIVHRNWIFSRNFISFLSHPFGAF